MKEYLKLIRPHQWIKNGFIFLPLFFSLRFNDFRLLLETSVIALAFCLIASAIYVLNDLKDVEEDRNHPVKKKQATGAGNCIRAVRIISYYRFSRDWLARDFFFLSLKSFYVALAYLGINFLYSLGLKGFIFPVK